MTDAVAPRIDVIISYWISVKVLRPDVAGVRLVSADTFLGELAV